MIKHAKLNTRVLFMKAIYILFFCCIFLVMSFEVPKKKVIFFGDSITDYGAQPGGYILKIDSLSKLEGYAERVSYIGKGVGGDKIYDLYLRLDEDVLGLHPEIVVVYIGVNDIWHKSIFGTGTDLEKFHRFYDAIIKKLRKRGIQPIICTPTVIGEKKDCTNPLDGEINLYAEWIRTYAKDNGVPLVDLRKLFLDYLRENNKENVQQGILTKERVHLNEAGNNLVASSIWKELRKLVISYANR